MSRDARSWAEALLGFASGSDIEEQRAHALDATAMASASAAENGHSNPATNSVTRYLEDPGVDRKAKSEALAAMLPDDEPWGAFCELLVRSHACRLLPRISKEYRKALDRKAGVEHVLIESPRPLDELSRAAVLEAWSSIHGPEKIIVHEVAMPSLLGGFRFTSGSIRYDASIAGKLRQLRDFLAQPLPRTPATGEGRQ